MISRALLWILAMVRESKNFKMAATIPVIS
jgi:hypothetical protein